MSIFQKFKNLYFRSSSKRFVAYLRSQGVAIGENVHFIAPRSQAVDLTRPHLLTIGNNVIITRGVVLLTHGYEWFVLKNVYGRQYGSAGEIVINDNVYIGMNAILLKGVSVGPNSVIGAGSVVNRDVPPNTVAVGNPARVVCTLDELHAKNEARQISEAKADIHAFYKRYGRYPEKSQIREFAHLFDEIMHQLDQSGEELF